MGEPPEFYSGESLAPPGSYAHEINAKKKQVRFETSPKDTVKSPPSIKLGDVTLENVENFAYLGSILSSNADADAEMNHRTQAAAVAFANLVPEFCGTGTSDWTKSSKFTEPLSSQLCSMALKPGPHTKDILQH